MPQRAKVRRVWRLRKGISSGGPSAERDGRRSSKPPSNRPGTSAGRHRPDRRRGRAGVSTSTIGSSQNRPREPLRTISTRCRAACASSRSPPATLSAPTRERAGIARDEDARWSSIDLPRDLVDRCGVSRADQLAVEHRRRRAGAEARGNRPLERHPAVARGLAEVDAEQRSSTWRASASPPIDWQASARQSFSTCRPAGWLRKS